MLGTITQSPANAKQPRENRSMKCLRHCLLLQFLLVATLAQAEPRVEIFDLKNRPADAIIDQLQALYPGQGNTFSQDGQRLMIKAEPQVIEEVATLIERLDVAPAQMRITLRRQMAGRSNSDTSTTLTTRDSQSEQNIVVQDGETARIESGTIRQVTRAVQGGRALALISEDTRMTGGFLVQPRALGPRQVELRIMAFNDEPPHHQVQSGSVDTAAVVTMRRVTPGEWVTLGVSEESSTSGRTGPTYSTDRARTGRQQWSIKVDILQ